MSESPNEMAHSTDAQRPLKFVQSSRNQAILAFNRRVLAQALRVEVPPLERLRYVCIVSSNVDEFFEVRFADVLSDHVGDLGPLSEQAAALLHEQSVVFKHVVVPLLLNNGIRVLEAHEISPVQRRWLRQLFHLRIRPALQPRDIRHDPSLSAIPSRALNLLVRMRPQGATVSRSYLLSVPKTLPRVVEVPTHRHASSAPQRLFMPLISVLELFLPELFAPAQILAHTTFRITRHSELEVDTDDVSNLRQALRRGLTTRHLGRAVRLELPRRCPESLRVQLKTSLDLPDAAVFRVDAPLNLSRFSPLIEQIDTMRVAAGQASLRFPEFKPRWPDVLRDAANAAVCIFNVLREQDILLHHPFESFEPVEAFLRAAAQDPDVRSIQQTIYRIGNSSALMDGLMQAAQAGKRVLAVVELKARFDEEANINWAERLEAAGVEVVYGLSGLKTHAKMLLVTRLEKGHAVRYVHLSTGNYNAQTAKLYTDVGLMTAHADITHDAEMIFQQLKGQGRARHLRQILQAPYSLHKGLIKKLDRLTEAAQVGQEARIILKLNALTDSGLMAALLRAAHAGAQIDLIVRGACTLPLSHPLLGSQAQLARIRVRSVVGRFLEHTRLLYLEWGAAPDEQVLYLSSADWMGRNMFGRVEIAWPVLDEKLRQRVLRECLEPYLSDTEDSWLLQSNGSYRRMSLDLASTSQTAVKRYSAQQALLKNLTQRR
jgi:polyphosphate kinase